MNNEPSVFENSLNQKVRTNIMKTLVRMWVAGALLALVSVSSAQDADGVGYIRANVGAVFIQDVDLKTPSPFVPEATMSWDPGFRLDVAGGYFNTNGNWGVELETGVLTSTADEISSSGFGSFLDITVYQVPILVNVIGKLPLSERFKPYLGVGAGGVLTIMDDSFDSYNDFTFAYQVMAGIAFEADENIEINLGYKFQGSLENDIGNAETGPILSHSIIAGFTFKF